MPSAVIVSFASYARANRFTVRDRLDLQGWGEIAGTLGFDRLVVHERLDGDPPDVGDYLALYPRGRSWATWCLSRRSSGIVAWHCASGLDSGCFATVGDALAAILGVGRAPATFVGGGAGAADERPRRGMGERQREPVSC